MTIYWSYRGFSRVAASLGRHGRFASTTMIKNAKPKTLIEPQRAEKKFSGLQRFSTSNTNLTPLTSSSEISFDDCSAQFMTVYKDVINDITSTDIFEDVQDIPKWLTEVLHYNVSSGNLVRGLTCVTTYKRLEDPKNLTAENIYRANIMGLCIELFNVYVSMYRDIIDESTFRQGALCWYKVNNLGTQIINDSLLVQSIMYLLIMKYIFDQPYSKDIIQLFNDILCRSSMGKYKELQTVKKNPQDLSMFTFETYDTIAKYKSAYHTIISPVEIAMRMCGINDQKIYQETANTLMDIGKLYQIQEDYLDCFGDPAVTGKVGTDIGTGKCTWLAVTALQKANPEQRKTIETYYGSSKAADVKRIIDLYKELNIRDEYFKFEETKYEELKDRIRSAPEYLPRSIFTDILDRIYKRNR